MADLLRQINDRRLPITQTGFRLQGSRLWRFDWLIGKSVAVDFDASIFSTGSHRTAGELARIQDKLNEAQAAGFVVIRANVATVRDGTACNQIALAHDREVETRGALKRQALAHEQELRDLRRIANGLLMKLDKCLTK